MTRSLPGITSTTLSALSAFVVTLTALSTLAPTPLPAQRWTLPDSAQTEVDRVFRFVERGEPGCALGVLQDGRMVYGGGYGLANLDWGVPLSTWTVFDIGSVSKQFTAAAVALLDIDGTLSLDDDVRTWVPEMPDYGETVTLRHLLHHTSGVRDYLTLESIAGTDYANIYTEFDGVEMIARQRGLNFAPGSDFLYSNSGYLLLAHVVRRATGASLRTFLAERVFDPLGMAHTSIWDDNTEILAERATGYEPAGEGGSGGDGGGADGRDAWRIDHAWNFQMGGDGQVITSVEDLAEWDANFYDPVVGGEGLLERLHARGVLTTGDTIDYALGLSEDDYRGLRRVAHGGSWAGFRASFVRFPTEHTSVIALCNRADANPGSYTSDVADIVLADRFPEERVAVDEEPGGEEAEAAGEEGAVADVELSTEQLARWAGLYRHPERPAYREFVVEGGALNAVRRGRRIPLVPRSETEFEAPGPGIVMTFSEVDGERRVGAGDGEDDDAYREVTPTTDPDLAAYVGTYHSDELDVDFRVTVEDGGLRFRRVEEEHRIPRPERGREEGRLLEPGAEDEFYDPGTTLTFEREDGRVVGFRMYAGRVTDLVFRRLEG